MPKKIPYWQQMRDPRWQRKRLEIMQRDGFQCCWCSEQKQTLNVHHRWYVAGRMIWEYPDIALKTLCEDCHEIIIDLCTEVEDGTPMLDFERSVLAFESSNFPFNEAGWFASQNNIDLNAFYEALAFALNSGYITRKEVVEWRLKEKRRAAHANVSLALIALEPIVKKEIAA